MNFANKTDDELRDILRAAGGQFHGPLVEHLSIPETMIFAFLRTGVQQLQAKADTKSSNLLVIDERLEMWARWAEEDAKLGVDQLRNRDRASVYRELLRKRQLERALLTLAERMRANADCLSKVILNNHDKGVVAAIRDSIRQIDSVLSAHTDGVSSKRETTLTADEIEQQARRVE